MTVELAVLRAEPKPRDDVIHRMQDEVDDLRLHRDRLLDQTNRLTMLLTAPAKPTEPEPIKSEPVRVPWYKRLFP